MITAYRNVTLRCYPILPDVEELLNKTFMQLDEFLEMSTTEFKKLLYHNAKKKGSRLPTRTFDLEARRYSKTVLKNKIIPLDKSTYKIVRNEYGYYEIEVKLLGNRATQDHERVIIPISRSDNDYYGDVLEGTAYGAELQKKGSDVFLSLKIPVKMRCRKKLPAVFIGIDLNMQKDAASLYNPGTEQFEKNMFFDRRPVSKTLDRLDKRISRITKGMRKQDWTDEIKEEIGDIYRRRTEAITNSHGNFISELLELANSYVDEQNVIFVLEDLKGITKNVSGSKSFNRWLHAKWCFGRFRTQLETKGFPVIDVFPFHTSQNCHRCGVKGIRYGHRDRLFKCDSCGLEDFNRDLNAARNIAVRGFKRLSPKSQNQKVIQKRRRKSEQLKSMNDIHVSGDLII